jgi:hypothetical protein
MIRIEHDAATGEIKEIELSEKEIKEIQKEYAKTKAENDLLQAEAEAKETAKAAILDRIGLTADELKTILG